MIMRQMLFSRIFLVILFVVLMMPATVSCGGPVEKDSGNVLLGPYYAINCPEGFQGRWMEDVLEISGNPFSVIVEVKDHQGALIGDIDTIEEALSAVESELVNMERETIEEKDTIGVLITGNTDKKMAVALFVPVEERIITVFTDPLPNTKGDFDKAVDIVKSFRLTDPDYFDKDDNNTSDSNDGDVDNSNGEDQDNSNGNFTDSNQDDKTELYSNKYIDFEISPFLELTSDDDRLTILEPKEGVNSDLISLSIQYVNLGDDMKVEEYAQGIADQLNSSITSMELGNIKYRLIESKSDSYSEFHLVAERDDLEPLMISVFSWSNRIPDDAMYVLKTIEMK